MDYPKLIDATKNLLTIIALIVGGVISWIKFVGGRADKIRLEPTVSGEFFGEDKKSHILITIGLENKGLFAASIPTSGFHLEVFESKVHLEAMDIQSTEWKTLTVFQVFVNHDAIQTGESVSEQLRLIVSNNKFAALRFRLRVAHSDHKLWFLTIRRGTEWEAMTIISCQAQPDQSL